MDSIETVRDTLVETLNKQLSELDLLKSMYPSRDEIILTDNSVIEDMKKFVDNKSHLVPNNLDFVLKLHINGTKLELYINLPNLYPNEEPDVYVRCNQLNRHQETKLNSELLQYIKSIFQNELCLYTVISWLHENIDIFKVTLDVLPEQKQPEIKNKSSTFVRHWIFSHHIYNKYKRDEIIKKSKELNLTGFCMPGKPGIICIEGSDGDCKEWWKDIKTMNWKKISIRKSEHFDINDQSKEKKFKDFQEITFQSTSKNSKNGFSKFIEEHNLSQEYNEFLGL